MIDVFIVACEFHILLRRSYLIKCYFNAPVIILVRVSNVMNLMFVMIDSITILLQLMNEKRIHFFAWLNNCFSLH